MVQTRSQVRSRRASVRARLNNIYRRAANYTNVNRMMRSTNTSRRVGYILNAAQRIGQAFQRYRRRKTARIALNRSLPSDMSRLIGTYL